MKTCDGVQILTKEGFREAVAYLNAPGIDEATALTLESSHRNVGFMLGGKCVSLCSFVPSYLIDVSFSSPELRRQRDSIPFPLAANSFDHYWDCIVVLGMAGSLEHASETVYMAAVQAYLKSLPLVSEASQSTRQLFRSISASAVELGGFVVLFPQDLDRFARESVSSLQLNTERGRLLPLIVDRALERTQCGLFLADSFRYDQVFQCYSQNVERRGVYISRVGEEIARARSIEGTGYLFFEQRFGSAAALLLMSAPGCERDQWGEEETVVREFHALCDNAQIKLMPIFEEMHQYAVGKCSHVYVPFCCVRPEWRSRRVGWEMFNKFVFPIAHQVGCVVYLEHNDPPNDAFYRKLGFISVGKYVMRAYGESTDVNAMIWGANGHLPEYRTWTSE